MPTLRPSGRRMAAARRAAGLTQREAIRALRCSRATLVNTETGYSEPRAGLLGRMAVLYRVPVDSLYEFTPEPSPDDEPEAVMEPEAVAG